MMAVGATACAVLSVAWATAIGATAAIGAAAVGIVTVFDEQRSTGTSVLLLAAAAATADAVVFCRETAYGAVGRMRRTSVGFGAFGAQTAAQGSNPTKRSPTGLASGVGWELIFIPFLQSKLV